jgi:hypothetical protein
MNASIPQSLSLTNTYERDVKRIFQQAQDQINQQNSVGEGIYLKAQQECEKPGTPYSIIASCTNEYVKNNNPNIDFSTIDVSLPDSSLYKIKFQSPLWTFDFAGIFLSISFLSFGFLMARIILARIFRKKFLKQESLRYVKLKQLI